jgi:hypothetical protein
MAPAWEDTIADVLRVIADETDPADTSTNGFQAPIATRSIRCGRPTAMLGTWSSTASVAAPPN